MAVALQFGRDLAVLLGRLYTGRLSGKPHPDDREIFEVRLNRARAQTATDAKRAFFDTIGTIRRLMETDPTRIDQASGMYAGAAAHLAFAGLSFSVGKRCLAVGRGLVREGNPREHFTYLTMQFIHDFLTGQWADDPAIADELVEQALGRGQLWDVNTFLDLRCERRIRQGRWAGAESDIAKMVRVAEVLGYDFARSNQYNRTAQLFVEQRAFDRALEALDLYAGRDEKVFQLLALGSRAKVELLRGQPERAEESVERAEAIIRELRVVPAYYLSAFLTNRLTLDVDALEQQRGGHGRGSRARRDARRALRIAAWVPLDRTEIQRLVGRLHWTLGRRERALVWWGRSVATGEQLGARPELARTCLEIARRLGPGQHVGGLPAGAWLDRARTLFTDLGLDEELEQRAA
jgi:tetratricopeptide (TPR) repeat protein